MNDTLSVDAGHEEAEAFLAGVESRVVPELVAHYKSSARPEGRAAGAGGGRRFREGARAPKHRPPSARPTADRQRSPMRSSIWATSRTPPAAKWTRRSRSRPASPPAADDEIRQHATAATDPPDGRRHCRRRRGDGPLGADRSRQAGDRRLGSGRPSAARRDDSLARMREAIKAASAALAANDYAGGARQLTALALARAEARHPVGERVRGRRPGRAPGRAVGPRRPRPRPGQSDPATGRSSIWPRRSATRRRRD